MVLSKLKLGNLIKGEKKMKKLIFLLVFTSILLAQNSSWATVKKDLNLKGDFRYRYEAKKEGDSITRTRFRYRFRLGSTIDVNQDWKIGFGFATGGNTSSKETDTGTSTNQTIKEGTDEISLDYAFVQHKNLLDGTLLLGRFKNPFKISKALFDGDLRPGGLAYTRKVGTVKLIIANLLINGDSGKNEETLTHYTGLQAVWSHKDLTVALAYYDHTSGVGADNSNKGKHDINQFQVYVDYKTKMNDIELTTYLDLYQNIGADGKSFKDKDDNDELIDGANAINLGDNAMALALGIEFKFATKTKLGIAYASYGEGSVRDNQVDSDSAGKNSSNIILKASHPIAKSATLGFTHYIQSVIEGDGENTNLTQLDILYKF